jgi:hypothetical protein
MLLFQVQRQCPQQCQSLFLRLNVCDPPFFCSACVSEDQPPIASTITTDSSPIAINIDKEHEADEGNDVTNDENDLTPDDPKLFSVINLEEDEDVQTEMWNHPSVWKAVGSLNMNTFLTNRQPITKPTANIKASANNASEPLAMDTVIPMIEGFIFPNKGKTAFPDVKMGDL